jgi:membrane-associated protease RseP (regulator of RpoE activity)
VSDETPTGETEPTPTPADAAAEEPTAAPEPAATSANATAPEPVSAEPVAAEPVTAEPVTAETAVAPAAVPVATAAAPPPEQRSGILLPTWVAVVLAVLLIGGVGFAIGYWTGGDDGSDAANASSSQVAPSRPGPFGGNGGGYNGGTPNLNPNGNGNGNGQTTAQTAFLGVSVEGVANNGGARVTDARAGSPAADAGLKAGDVITKIGGTTVANGADLIRAVQAQKPGDEVTVTYTRDGNSAQATVTLGNRSDATRSSVSP